MDGRIEDGSIGVPIINLWDNYQTRSRVVARVPHGEQVKFIRRSGDGILIETKSGQRGWVTYWFIKEFK